MTRRSTIAVLLAALPLATTAPLAAQTSASPPIVTAASPLSADDLREDVAVLERAFRAAHPGLLRYRTPRELDSLFAELATRLGRDQTLGEAFVALSRFTAALRCGHTYPNFWNQTDAIQRGLLEGPDKLPFTYRLVGRRMIVERSAVPGGAVRRGDEVLAIDGVAAASLVDSLVALVRADGDNDGKRRSQVELRGIDRYEAADALLPLLLTAPGGTRAAYEVTIARPGLAPRTVRVAAMRAADRRAAALPLDAPRDARAPWSWRIEGGVGVLASAGFVGRPDSGGWPWRAFVERAFGEARARGLRGIVLDLRENEGGRDEDAMLLLAHLSTRPFAMPRVRQVVSYERIPADVRSHVFTWDPSFYDRTGRVTPLGDGTFLRRSTEDWPDTVTPAPLAFDGRVVILAGPVMSSASHLFTMAAREAGVATVVGEPTGGSRRGLTGSEYLFLRLPRSRLEVDIPLVATWYDGDRPATGVVPDVPVAPTVADVRAVRDVALARAIAVARGR